MKQTRLWLITIAVLLCSVTANAYDFEVEGIYYNIISTTDLTIKVTSGDNKYIGEITIPSTITYKSRTLKVVAIGDQAFYYCDSLANIIIPNTVTGIGESAFRGCCGLTSVVIPNSVTTIGNYAFNGCTSLVDLCMDDGEMPLSLGYSHKGGYDSYGYYSNGEGLFFDCPLKELNLGRNLSYETEKNYGYSPFYNKTTLTSVTIGDSVTNIGQSAFNGCSGLTNITIPNGVTTIGNRAFYGCTSLKDLQIEDGEAILELGYNIQRDKENESEGLFYDCPLEKIYLGRNVEYKIYEDRYYCGYSPFYNRKELKILTIGNHVTTIGANAFRGCSGLSEILIPNSVTSIGDDAFHGCTGLVSITIGNSVSRIGKQAFEWCSGLTSITIPNNVAKIGFYAFGYCTSLKELYIEDGDLTLHWGDYGYHECYFRDCPIEKVYLGRNLAFNGDEDGWFYAISNRISSLTIGNCVTRISNKVFWNFAQDISIYLMCTTPPTIGEKGDAAYVNWNIYVPQGSLAAYQTTDVWKEFWNIQEYLLDKYFYVNYIINGEPYAVDSVKHGDTIIPKEVSVKEGQAFSGWRNLPEFMPANDITVYGAIHIETDSIILDKQAIITTVNSAYQLYTTVYPEDATDKIVWTSSDDSVAKVSESGYVTGVSVGKVTITATCGNVSASCEVEVEVENFIKTQPAAENLLVELNTPEEGVKYQWYQYIEEMIYSKEIIPTSSGDLAWTESDGIWTSGNKGLGQTKSIMTATVDVQIGDTISFDFAVPAGDGDSYRGTQWFAFYVNGDMKMQSYGGINGATSHYELVINDWVFMYWLNNNSKATIGFECVRNKNGNEEHATVSNIKLTRPDGFCMKTESVEIIGATSARLEDSLLAEGGVVYCVVTLPNGKTLTSDKVDGKIFVLTYIVDGEVYHTDTLKHNSDIVVPETPIKEGHTFSGWSELPEAMPAENVIVSGSFVVNTYKVYYYIEDELVNTEEVTYGEAIPEYIYESIIEGEIFMGWIGDSHETMPAHDITYIANIVNGIEQITNDNSQMTIYDLQGRRVLDVENMKAGLYIVNGRKVLIK